MNTLNLLIWKQIPCRQQTLEKGSAMLKLEQESLDPERTHSNLEGPEDSDIIYASHLSTQAGQNRCFYTQELSKHFGIHIQEKHWTIESKQRRNANQHLKTRETYTKNFQGGMEFLNAKGPNFPLAPRSSLFKRESLFKHLRD